VRWDEEKGVGIVEGRGGLDGCVLVQVGAAGA
jgi:hypothetical protein